MNLKKMSAYTKKYDSIVPRILSICGVSNAMTVEDILSGHANSLVVTCNALWDTGATQSCISSRLAEKLDLKVYQRQKFQTPTGIVALELFRVNLSLDNKEIPGLIVPCIDLDENVDFLIGMDVITLGDFAVTNMDERTTFSFRIPSAETIDFMKQ